MLLKGEKKKSHQKVLSLLCSLYLDGSIHVGLFDAQHNLPGDSDAIEKVVDETHVVYEGVNVTGAQHQQSGEQLNVVRGDKIIISDRTVRTRGSDTEDKNVVVVLFGLTVNSKAGIGVQRVT